MREAGAAVTVRTYWAWETTATLRLLGGARRWGAHGGRRGAEAYRVATRTACLESSCTRTGLDGDLEDPIRGNSVGVEANSA